jgi:P27 family predicted phage terminase small subunit
MAMKGPAPLSKQTLAARGSWRAEDRSSTLADIDPQQLGKAVCPKWLCAEGKKHWREVAPELEARGVLTALDQGAFIMFCQSWATWQHTQQTLDREGLTVKSKKGVVRPHPLLRVLRDSERQYHTLGREFGLTPLSRPRVRTTPKPPVTKLHTFRMGG